MTPEDCEQLVAELEQADDDDEDRHMHEDEALYLFVQALADGKVRDPQACAAVLLRMQDIEFTRWFA